MNAKIADSEIFQHETAGGIVVERVRHLTAYKGAIETYIDALNERRGAVFRQTTNIQAAIRDGIQLSSILPWPSRHAPAACASKR